jgi:CRISPR-associated protein Csb1
MSQTSLDPKALLESKAHRLTLHAILAPTAGKDRIQPAGFPEIGHVIYPSPQPDGTTRNVCIVDSAASMANHLETVCHEGRFGLDLHADLDGLPHVQCVTDDTNGGKTRLVVTTLSEGHRLASSLFTDDKSKVEAPASIKGKNLGAVLLTDEFKLEDLGKRSHPLPADWWNVFKAIFKYDPNSLVHGILFPAMGIKIPRVLTAQLDAINAARVASSGVKFDKLLMTTSGQPIFAKDEETATEIRATFVLDLSLIRSFGRGDNGLNEAQKTFLIAFSLWKITQLLQNPFSYRSGCDLEFKSLILNGEYAITKLPEIKIGDYMGEDVFKAPAADRVTKVYWKKEDLFKKAIAKKDTTEDGDAGSADAGDDDSDDDNGEAE